MLNKHLLTFVVSGGEDDKKNVGKKVFECLDTVCVYLGDMDQGHQMCRFRMMELKIQLVSTPWGIRGNAWKQHGAVKKHTVVRETYVWIPGVLLITWVTLASYLIFLYFIFLT